MGKAKSIVLVLMSLALGLGLSLLFHLFIDPNPIAFESLESKTKDGNPVFNRIRFLAGTNIDTWIMQQSHSGLNDDFSIWEDRLAIVVDKSKAPYEAAFYQLSSGDLNIAESLVPVPLKTRCYACHPSGPRVIRPNLQSVQLGLKDKARIYLWNLRIKIYGETRSVAGSEETGGVPFSANQNVLKQTLNLKSCDRCHFDGGLRSALKLEHLTTAKFLVDQGFMPPFPFQMDEGDREVLSFLTDR